VEKEIKIKSLAIQAPQIRQILLALQDELGENPEYKRVKADLDHEWKLSLLDSEISKQVSETIRIFGGFILVGIPEKQSEALCKKWVDTLTPLFDKDPEKVLTEFLELLENLNNQ